MKSTAWKQLGLLMAAALVVRLAVAVYWQSRLDTTFGFGDSQTYWTLARAIADGRPYRCADEDAQIFRTPGYPLLLSPIFVVGPQQPSVMWARAESAVLGTLTVAGVWYLGRLLLDDRCGLIAAAMAAFYPGAVALGVLVLSEAPFCLLMVVQMVLWTAAWKAERLRPAATLALVAGLVAGAATLVRPSWLLFTPLAAIVGLAFFGPRKRQAWIAAGLLVGLAAVMAPWWIRNYRLAGRFVPTTLQVGASLYDGLRPQATGASNMDFVPDFVAQVRRESPGISDIEFELRLDRRLRDEALSFARSHPGRTVQLAGVKFLRTWNIWPNEPGFGSWPIRAAVLCTYVPIMILGLIGAVRTIHCGWPYVLCWFPAVYFTMLHVIFVGSIRYRQPAMLGMMVLAAAVVGGWKKRGPPTKEGDD